MLPVVVVTWVVDESDRCFIADAVANLGLPPRSDDPALSFPPASPGVVVHVLGEVLDGESYWGLSETPRSGVIDICCSLPYDFSFIQENCDEFSLNGLSNSGACSDW